MLNRFIVAGTDPRCIYLAESLLAKGYDTAFLDKETAARSSVESIECDQLEEEPTVVIFSPAAKSSDVAKVMGHLRPGSVVIAGKLDDAALALADERRITTHNLQQDEGFAAANALPTAEGALMLVMENTPMTIAFMPVLILGGGKCARAAADLFARCRALPTLVARKQADRDWAVSQGINALGFDELSALNCPVILNTVPAHVVPEAVLETMQPGTLWVELASKPGGIDEQLALELGCRYLPAPGLPGRVAPLSAAQIMEQTILEILTQER